MIDYEDIPFLQARWYTPTTGRPIRLIVLHSMEAPEKGDTAEAVARYFSTLTRKASAHYCVDANSIVQCLQTRDVAYAAPGANRDGVHIEMAGYARQTREDWEDAYSDAVLRNAAGLCAKVLLPKFGLPAVYLDAAKLRAGHRGITTHYQVTLAYHQSTHTDPGPGFPMDRFFDHLRELA